MKYLSCLSFPFFLVPLIALAHLHQPVSQTRFAHFGSIKIHYETVGNSTKALVFVHGWACNASFWKHSIRAFPGYHVIAVDLPGHGQSDKPRTDYSMEFYARSLEAVMLDAGVKEAVLVGHSMGTSVIRQFYRRYPEQTLGLVVVDGSLRADPKEQTRLVIAMLRDDYRASAPKQIDRMLQPIRDEQLKLKIRSAMLATPDYVALSEAEAMTDEGIWTKDKINVPVLAILAAESPWWEPDTESFFRSIAPNIDFQMWPGVSHFLMLERPSQFNDSIRLFVSRNKLL